MTYEVDSKCNPEAYALLEKARRKGVDLSYHQIAKRTGNAVLSEGIVSKKQAQDLKEKYVRVLHENRLGYFKYNMDSAEPNDILVSAISSSQFSDEVNFQFPSPATLNHPKVFDENVGSLSSIELERMCYSVHQYVKEKDPTLQSDISIGVESSTSEVINTSGFAKGYQKTGLTCHVWLKKPLGSRVILNYDNLQSCRLTDVKPLIDTMVEEISWSLRQVHLPPADSLPVVLSPSILSQIFKPFVSFFNAQSICQGYSLVGPAHLGKQMFDERITIRDDGITDWKTQSKPFDAEGTPAQSHTLVDKGKVNSFLCDLVHSQQLGMKPTGNFKFVQSKPAVFINNLTIDGGNIDFRSMLKDIGQALYIGTGMVEWEGFSNLKIVPSNSYLIQDGQISGTIVEHFQLAGLLADVFNKIIHLSSDTKSTKSGMEIPYMATSGLVILR